MRPLYDLQCWLVDRGVGRQYPHPRRLRPEIVGRSGTPKLDMILKVMVLVVGLWIIFMPIVIPLIVGLIVVFS
jgi:hypothetical protein